jgi:hypothetical protein
MEPLDLKSPTPGDDQLEAWLRANASATPLPDDGFTQRVLTSLPPQAQPEVSRRAVFCLVGALAGVALPFLTGISPGELSTDAAALGRNALPVLRQFADPNLVLALVVTGLCLLYVFGPRVRVPTRQ